MKKTSEIGFAKLFGAEWLLSFIALASLKSLFNEDFVDSLNYSDRIKMNAGKFVGSVVRLRPEETTNYL